MPTDPNDPLSNQKLKERYYGTEDPVADKLMKQASDMPQLTAPDDRTVTSLYVGGVEDDITEKDLGYGMGVRLWALEQEGFSSLSPPPLSLPSRSHFYQFGELQGIHLVSKQKCAFVTFTTREAAEKAADGSFNKIVIKGKL